MVLRCVKERILWPNEVIQNWCLEYFSIRVAFVNWWVLKKCRTSVACGHCKRHAYCVQGGL